MAYSSYAYSESTDAVETKADLDVAISQLPEEERQVVGEVIKGFTLSEIQLTVPNAEKLWERAVLQIAGSLG